MSRCGSFSKFHCLFPLINKCPKKVSKGLVEKVLSILGLPKILHSDNGEIVCQQHD